jgi:hypothetical protein
MGLMSVNPDNLPPFISFLASLGTTRTLLYKSRFSLLMSAVALMMSLSETVKLFTFSDNISFKSGFIFDDIFSYSPFFDLIIMAI